VLYPIALLVSEGSSTNYSPILQ